MARNQSQARKARRIKQQMIREKSAWRPTESGAREEVKAHDDDDSLTGLVGRQPRLPT